MWPSPPTSLALLHSSRCPLHNDRPLARVLASFVYPSCSFRPNNRGAVCTFPSNLVNYVSCRRSVYSGIETGEKGQLGTVYCSPAFVILIPVLWNAPAILAVSLMPLI